MCYTTTAVMLHAMNVLLLLQSSVIRMLDVSNWELLGLAVDAFVVYLLNHFYKSQIKDADLIMVSLLP